jgi:hypothetical protein
MRASKVPIMDPGCHQSAGHENLHENFDSTALRPTIALGSAPVRSRRVTIVDDSCWH